MKVKFRPQIMPPLILSALSIGLLTARFFAVGSTELSFLIWNLFLAWLPLVFMWWLRSLLYTTPWSRLGPVVLTALWLVFLPNSFYLVTDLVHLEPSNSISYMYDMVMLTSFVLAGVIVGMMSIYLMHMALRRRLGARAVYIILGAVFLLSSLGIYFGRFLGWNSWDIVLNPLGLFLDVADRLVNPTQHQNTYTTTMLFFVFMTGAYSSFYWSVKSLKSAR